MIRNYASLRTISTHRPATARSRQNYCGEVSLCAYTLTVVFSPAVAQHTRPPFLISSSRRRAATDFTSLLPRDIYLFILLSLPPLSSPTGAPREFAYFSIPRNFILFLARSRLRAIYFATGIYRLKSQLATSER